jgi:capsular exopolysaccharide synthesis family protein
MSLYLENGILTDRAKAVVARNFIIRQLPKTEAIVRQAEAALRRFKEINNVADLDEEAKLAVEAVADFKKQVATTRTQLKNAEARSEALRNQLSMNPQEAVAVSSLSQSPAVQEVLEEFQQVEGELTVARTRYQEEHPIVADLRTKEAGLKALVQERTKQDLEDQKQKTDGKLQIRGLKQELISDFVNLNLEKIGLATQVAALSNEQLNNEQRIKVLPRLEQTQRQLERQVEAAQSTYQVLLQKLQETRIAENQNEGNARIVEYARVPKKFLLKPIVLKLALGGILGSLLFVATVFVLEVRDKSIKTVKEAREILGYTLLGIIPFLEKPEKIALRSEDPELSAPKLIVRDKPRSPISEAYRMLQSNLKFLNSDTELKTIVVTSCVAGEGKSSVSANLAVAIAQRGRRVLLIDGDMRRPIQHQIWELSNGMGLSDLIVGQVELKTVVKEVMDNLHVLTAGVMPPNPGALLDSKRMASLIKRFSDSYDFVIMDTPPLIAADDPRILGKMADGVVLVVRPGVVDSTSATSSKELLNQLDQNILGLVVNGVMPENEPHSYYYYAKEYYAEEDVKPTNVRV